MNINIKATNLELTPTIREYVEEKIGSLERFITRTEIESDLSDKGRASIEARVEVGTISRRSRKGDIFRAEVQLEFFGNSLRSEAIKNDIYLAINEAKDELQRSIKRHCKRKNSLYIRGSRSIKKFFSIDPMARFRKK